LWELIVAVANNNIEEVKKLISMGANLNQALKIDDELPKICPLFVVISYCRNNDCLEAILTQPDLDFNPTMEIENNTTSSTKKHMSLREYLTILKQDHVKRIKNFESYII
jgi:hypothetical protein